VAHDCGAGPTGPQIAARAALFWTDWDLQKGESTMLKRSSRAGVAALVVALGAGIAGCTQIGMLKGKLAFKEANALYSSGNYEGAVEKYEEALAEGCTESECQPAELAFSYFFIGNSYDNMFRPARKGQPENDGYLNKAVDFYAQAAEKSPDPEYRKRALQFMVGVYGADKLNDPAAAEPIVQRLIELDPQDTTNYYRMAKLYEDAGEFEKAEEQYLKARDAKPDDPEVYGHLAGYYEARGDFQKQVEAMKVRAEKDPTSPETHYRIAVAYWNRACIPVAKFCEPYAGPPGERARNVAAGLEESEKALKIRGDYTDALFYKQLLLRSKAYLEPGNADALIKQANQIRDEAIQIQEKRKAEPAKK
jgi:tetratricopeptide (TPR) repeat protein